MFAARVVTVLSAACIPWCGWGASEALAQRGVGDDAGIARQAVKPAVVSLSGKITSVETGPCMSTTGRAEVGTHVHLETPKGRALNIHLGPQAEVDQNVLRCVGETVLVGIACAVVAYGVGAMVGA